MDEGIWYAVLKVWKMILDSSMVEHSAVNRVVVGSSPTRGASGRGTGHYGGIRDGFFILQKMTPYLKFYYFNMQIYVKIFIKIFL